MYVLEENILKIKPTFFFLARYRRLSMTPSGLPPFAVGTARAATLVIVYLSLGFALVYFALELTWPYTACRLPDRSIK
jgi:hypothetical protein